MTSQVYDRIVIGAGIQGSATAYYLAKEGKKTLLLEQFKLPHTNGSSHGKSRIIRNCYAEDYFAQLTHDAYKEWEKITDEAKVNLYTKAGTLAFGAKSEVDPFAYQLEKNGSPHRVLNPAELKEKYPFFSLGDDIWGVLDHEGGILEADKALETLQGLFQKDGGTLLDEHEVLSIEPGSTIKVKTNKGTYEAPSIALCVGTWAGPILKSLDLDLPLKPIRVFVFYWDEKRKGEHTPENGFPTFIDLRRSENEVYGLPTFEFPGKVKVCGHGIIDFDGDENGQHETVAKWIGTNMPGLVASKASHVVPCKYTMTPDESFILDKHPKYQNIAIGAGFSGTGFKMAPVVGKILSDLTNDRTPHYNMKAFKLDRFNS